MKLKKLLTLFASSEDICIECFDSEHDKVLYSGLCCQIPYRLYKYDVIFVTIDKFYDNNAYLKILVRKNEK